jgi:hypothetical protein
MGWAMVSSMGVHRGTCIVDKDAVRNVERNCIEGTIKTGFIYICRSRKRRYEKRAGGDSCANTVQIQCKYSARLRASNSEGNKQHLKLRWSTNVFSKNERLVKGKATLLGLKSREQHSRKTFKPKTVSGKSDKRVNVAKAHILQNDYFSCT